MSALLQTRSLTKAFGGVIAVNDVDFALQEGELRCLIGPNGAGKSTFFKMLTGQIVPTAGNVLLRDRNICGAPPYEIARLGIGIKTQTPSVFDGLSVRENLWIAARRRDSAGRTASTVLDLLDRLSLDKLAATRVGHLSHGQRQWVEIATVLAGGPDIILLDEPAAGMTQDEVERTATLIREINRTKSLIVVEHDMQFIRMIADKVTMFHQGRVLVEDKVDVVMRDPRVRDVYLGRKAAA